MLISKLVAAMVNVFLFLFAISYNLNKLPYPNDINFDDININDEFKAKIKNWLKNELFSNVKLSPRFLWYQTRGYKIMKVFQNNISKNKTILDLGSGPGVWTYILSYLGYKVIAIDSNKEFLVYSSYLADTLHINAKIEHLPLKAESVDVVLLSEVIEHFHYPQKILDIVNNILKKNGLLILTTPNGSYYLNSLPSYFESIHNADFFIHRFSYDGDSHFYNILSTELEQLLFNAKFKILLHKYYGSVFITNEYNYVNILGYLAKHLTLKNKLFLENHSPSKLCDGQIVLAKK